MCRFCLTRPTSVCPEGTPTPVPPPKKFVSIFYNGACVTPKPRKPWWYLDFFGRKNFPMPPIFPHAANFFQKLVAPNILGPPGIRGLPASVESVAFRLPLPLTVRYSIRYRVACPFTQLVHASTLPCFLLAPCLL